MTQSLFSPRGQAVRQSPTFEVDSWVRAVEAQGKRVINLGIGNPPVLLSCMSSAMQERVTNAYKNAFLGMAKYYPAGGLASLKEKVATYFGGYDPSEITITGDGGKGGLDASLFLTTSPGDVVLVPVPFWPSHLDLIRDLGCTPLFVSTYDSNFLLTPEQVETAFATAQQKPRVVLYNYANNPTGKSAPASVLAEIDAIAQKYGAVVISDEAYREQELDIFVDTTRTQDAKNYKVRVGTFSKFIGIAGERLGFMESSKAFATQATNYRANHGGNPPIAAMAYAEAMLGDPEFREMRVKAKADLKAKHEKAWEILADNGIDFIRPDGAFYVYLHLPTSTDGEKFTKELLEEKQVAVIPGTSFDPTDNPAKHTYFRIALGIATIDELAEAGKRIREFITAR